MSRKLKSEKLTERAVKLQARIDALRAKHTQLCRLAEQARELEAKKLELEAYEKKANEVLDKICENLRKKRGVIDVQIHHLIGEFDVGDDLVYVVVAGAHRGDIFPILEEAVERYKKEAPIFKKEYILSETGAPKSYWVSEREKGS